ncbi:RNA-guided endonuclease TnpB family protein [Longispora fulva]|uniref:IS605 OrfB family transposase n=1 Tax=Longispora fulva TaxID=619741 RepID=A0A8J7KXC8_9ACTN|nr:RNA-guided endonuclease TnpB family protein [Longispora fulva]MBG6137657.1 IS605 OrfB family transposase [Longispora fulva]
MSSRTVKRMYRYRFYPTETQAKELTRTFGCVRYVYNRVLAERSRLFLVESRVRALDPTDGRVGVDAGLTHLLTLSTGEKIDNPRHALAERRRLARAQQTLARKQKGSNNRVKARGRVARIHARIADRRSDLLHKVSTRLVRENQTVVIEDLAVHNMVKNRSLAYAISDAGWADLRRRIEYKSDWYGRELIVLNRWYPSTKLCSECGHLVDHVPLGTRSWTCPACNTAHDRDVNAARNILAAGLAERVNACGDHVSPPL